MSDAPFGWGILVIHPSRRAAVRDTVALLQARLSKERPGYMLWTLQTPLEPALAHARRAPEGAEFHLTPLLLAPGAHFTDDVQDLADNLRDAAPGLRVRIRPPLLEDPSFLTWLFDRL